MQMQAEAGKHEQEQAGKQVMQLGLWRKTQRG